MDNFSHSVAGLAVGELIHRRLGTEPDAGHHRTRRRLLLLTCWLASNFPDLDLFLTRLLPAPLGYLLHHRGHTHTILYALPQALLLALVLWLCWPAARRLLRASARARAGWALALVVGFSLHLAMDYLNSYGIHPFHPFDSRWYFGDMVFIVEPWFWIVFGVPLAMTIAPRWLRAALLGLLVGVPLYFTVQAYLAWTSWMVLAACAAALGLLQHRAGANNPNGTDRTDRTKGTAGLTAGVLLALLFVGVQAGASQQARRIVERALHATDPASRVLDVSLSSFPTNPLCWTFSSVESNDGAGTYRVRRGLVSTVSALLPVDGCPAGMADPTAQPTDTPAVAYVDQQIGDLSLLRKLRVEDCHFEAWLRFARVPMVSDGIAMDLRFSASPRGNFTALRLQDFAGKTCSNAIPGWDFPRTDLLAPN